MKIELSLRELRKKYGIDFPVEALTVYPPNSKRVPCGLCGRPSSTTLEFNDGTKRPLCGYHYIRTTDLYRIALKYNDTKFLAKVRPYLEANAP